MPIIDDWLTEDPTNQRVSITNVRTQSGWPYRDFLEETNRTEDEGSLGKDWLSWPGADVSFDVALDGYKRKQLEVVRWVVTAAGERVRSLYHANEPTAIVPPADTYTANPSIWVALPKKPGRYKITVGVYGQDGRRLSLQDSATFADVESDLRPFLEPGRFLRELCCMDRQVARAPL